MSIARGRWMIMLLFAAGGGACSPEPLSGPDATLNALAPAFIPPPCATGTAPNFTRRWNCGRVISVRADASAAPLEPAIRGAIQEWNRVLEDPRTPQLPRFLFQTSSTADVTVVRTGTGTDVCGVHDPETDVVTLHSWGGGLCHPNANHADPRGILVHEFLGVIGFDEGLEKAGVPGISDRCVNHLPADKATINSSLCQQEIEYLHATYGFRTAAIEATLWGEQIITGLSIVPSSLTFAAPGQTTPLSVTGLRFANQQGGNTGAPASFNWTSDDREIASVVGSSGIVTSVKAGSTVIRGRVSSGVPPGMSVAGVMRLLGSEVPVTVTAPAPPPPGSGFRVTDITGATAPITEPGFYPLRALVANAPAFDVYIRWQVTYSNGALPPDDETRNRESAYALEVPEGSYSITVTATPRSNGVNGTAWIEQFPVCTEGGGGGGDPGPQLADDPKAGGSPSAIPGC